MYRIVPDTAVLEQVAALPAEALAGYAGVLEVLQLTPWNGRPQHPANPAAPVRRWAFGSGQAGQVVYLILDEQQEVHLLLVQWLGLTGAAGLTSGCATSSLVGEQHVKGRA